MKRITALLALFVLLFIAAFGAQASETRGQMDNGQMEIIHNQLNNASSTVVYGIDEAYVVTVPAAIDLRLGENQEHEISITGVYMPLSKRINVSIESERYSQNKNIWYLLLDTEKNVRIPYSIKKGENMVASKDTLLYCDGGDNEESIILYFKVEAEPVQSGSYMDTLTFTVTIDDKN